VAQVGGSPMTTTDVDYLAMDDPTLLRQCEVHTYRASGPGGQHRNKTDSAVRLVHTPTGAVGLSADSRDQHANKRSALRRLRMNIALQVRRPVATDAFEPPRVWRGAVGRDGRVRVGRRDQRFWPIAQVVLDVLFAHRGRLGETAASLGISTGNLNALLKTDRHLWAAVANLRQQFDLPPLRKQ